MSATTKAHPPEASQAPDDEPDAEYAAILKRAAAFGMVKPDPVPPDQAWFWTKEWLAGEVEASEDIAAGRVYTQYSDEEFFAFLEARAAHANPRRG